jgi:multisubunit Na+/H+ antiporter MnhC subunit
MLAIVASIALTAAILMEAWQRKEDRKHWDKYENTRKKHD